MRFFPLILFFSTLFGHTCCGFLNATIDDTAGDPTTGARIVYGPSNAWASSNSPCPPFDIQSNKAFDNTWHSAIYSQEVNPVWASVNFTGNAVYVWGILAPCLGPDVGDATIGFTVDGVPIDKFRQASDTKSNAFQYDVLLFSATGLNNMNHTLVMGIGGGSKNAYAILDRISYTRVVEDHPSTTALPSAANLSPSTTTTRTSNPTQEGSTASALANTQSASAQTTTSSAGAAGSSITSTDASQGTSTSNSSQAVTGTIVGGLIGGCAALAAAFLIARWIWAIRQKKTFSDLEERYQYIDRDNLDCKSVEMREEFKPRDSSVKSIARMRESVLRSSKKLFPVMLLTSGRDSLPSTQH